MCETKHKLFMGTYIMLDNVCGTTMFTVMILTQLKV